MSRSQSSTGSVRRPVYDDFTSLMAMCLLRRPEFFFGLHVVLRSRRQFQCVLTTRSRLSRRRPRCRSPRRRASPSSPVGGVAGGAVAAFRQRRWVQVLSLGLVSRSVSSVPVMILLVRLESISSLDFACFPLLSTACLIVCKEHSELLFCVLLMLSAAWHGRCRRASRRR